MTLRHRPFILWLIATAQSQFGSALASIALSFLVLHQTGSAGRMAVTLACSLAPNLLMPLAGAWVDRVSLRVPLIGADLVRGALQLAVGGAALLWGEVPLWAVNVAAVLTGLAGAVAQPATGAVLPALVSPEDLPRANGMISSAGQGAWLAGTLSGGWIVAQSSPALAILLDGLSFLLMAGLLLFVTFPSRHTPQPPAGLWQELRAGLRLMRRSRLLSWLPALALLVNAAMGPILVVTPTLMDTLSVGAQGYGMFMALESAGLILAGSLIAALGSRLPLRRTTLCGFVLLVLALAGMYGWPTYRPLLACSFLAGLAVGLLNTPLFTLIQTWVPGAYLGRVLSVVQAAATFGMPLSLLAVSPWVDALPLHLWYGVNALTMAAGGLGWLYLMLIERTLPDLRVPEPSLSPTEPHAPATLRP